MQILKHTILFSVLLLTLIYSQTVTLKLVDWTFQISDSSYVYNTKIPSTLASDLINANLVQKDPYYRDNFLQYYKYQTKNVKYNIKFNLPTECQGSNIKYKLIFQGLDTHCDVYLNGNKILTAHNMFRAYQIQLSNMTVSNNLQVRFNSSANYDLQKQKQFYNQFQFNLPQNYSFTRKAAYQYGWDWGPRILTVGIWKQARLQCGYRHLIDHLTMKLQQPIKQRNPQTILFSVSANISKMLPSTQYTYQLYLSKNNNNMLLETSTHLDASLTTFNYTKKFSISNYIKNVSSCIWWTWDLGQQNLFTLSFIIRQSNKTTLQARKSLLVGFRTVTIKQQKDAIGNSFTLNLNGIDVFMRGGNYIPPQMAMDKVNSSTYKKIRQYALHGKYNMIRVWGGGQFENQQFYKNMDQAGILIWHDLMFACAMYPIMPGSDDAENIQKQMEDNLRRIGHHPSIGIWNGNNQVWIGWLEWGWKKGLDNLQIYNAQAMYKKIFQQILPSVISRITPNIFYWETSPSSSSNQVSSIGSGDIHFWRVWGGGTDIQQYQQYVGRFNSQYGMQSMPQYSSIIKFTNATDRALNSLILRLHQRHIYGDKYLPMYVNKYAGTTTDLSKFSYFSQIMQAYALQLAIVSLRGNKPICMGSLYWQLNDVWPVSSWATIDYYGTYKAAQYRVRQMHNQLLIHTIHTPKINTTAQSWKVIAVNDYERKISLFTIIKIMDFNGTVLNSYQIQKSVNPFQNIILMRMNITLNDAQKKRSFINVQAKDPSNNQTYINNYFFYPPVNRTKFDPKLTMTIVSDSIIRIKATFLATYVWMKSKSYISANLEKNFVDILPGMEMIFNVSPLKSDDVVVTCYECQAIKEIKENQGNQQIKENIRSQNILYVE